MPDTGTTDGSDTTAGTGPEIDPVEACTATCEHLVSCGVEDVPTCGIPCVGIGDTIVGCEPQYAAQQQCVLELSCDDAQTWADAMGVGRSHPCSGQDAALTECLDGA